MEKSTRIRIRIRPRQVADLEVANRTHDGGPLYRIDHHELVFIGVSLSDFEKSLTVHGESLQLCD